MTDMGDAGLVTVEFTLKLREDTMRAAVPVPAGEVTLTELLPILQTFTSAMTERMATGAAKQGQPVTCGPHCDACCRQLVPISHFEAEALAEWIRSLPEEQQNLLKSRFLQTLLRLEQAGVLARLKPETFQLGTEEFRQLGRDYFQAGAGCPFLVDGNCGIHPIRPLVCREYMVTTPPAYCAEPGHSRAQVVVLPIHGSRALMKLGSRVSDDGHSWLPLTFLFHWMTAGLTPGAKVKGTGPEVLREFVNALNG